MPLPNGHGFPDFNDCATNTVEPLSDWIAVVHRGGPVRGLDRHMPAFGEALTADQIERADSTGSPTTGLLTATQYLKDNRLLPRGFEKATASPEIAVHGDAAADPDFEGSGDRVRYSIDVSGPGPLGIEVELLYQAIGYRWAQNLAGYGAPEARRFVSYYRSMAASSSVVVGKARQRADAALPSSTSPVR